jgi:hypothetical protein
MFAADWQKELKPAAKKRTRKGLSSVPKGPATVPEANGDSRDEAAKQFGIGGRTVSKAANVLDKGCKQLQQAVKDGRVNVSLAEKIVKNLEGDAQQEAVAVAMVSDKPEKALREAVKPEPKPFNSDEEVDRIVEWLRKSLDKWPKESLPKAFSMINCILQEYK